MRTTPLVALAAVAGLALPAAAQDVTATPGLVTVNGVGEVREAPDMATVTSGVVTQGETAREALDANNAAMAELIAVLREAGIEDRDIQTSGFSVQPRYVYPERASPDGYSQPPRIVGYEVSNNVSVRVLALDDLGAILDQAVGVGANAINGISFGIADESAVLGLARQRAVADARDRAQLYADAAGVALGEIVTISEQPQAVPFQQPQAMLARAEMAYDSAVPVAAGELAFTSTITMQWRLDGNKDE